jgi:dienelactone hydrolase
MSPAARVIPLDLVSSATAGDIETRTVEYEHKGTVLESYFAIPKEIEGKHAAVLVAHDWHGLKKPFREIAERLARMGYIALAVDIYGKGIRPSDNELAAAEANKYKSDRALLRERVRAGLEELMKQPNVDGSRIAAIGYCFGGTSVLELARSGAQIACVVSFHGGLDALSPDDAKDIKAKVLALHGADDPFVPPEVVAGFQEEMRKGGVDWQLIIYGNAVHSFTLRTAGTDKSRGAAYDERADKRSWEAMKAFFKETIDAGR